MMEKETQSWVISVRYGKGCYRHIEVPKRFTFDELADVILWSFDFANDHGHAFFLDNRTWSHRNAYYVSWIDEEEDYPHTEDYSLHLLQLKQAFKFLFDFGECWEFQCKVLREVSGGTESYLLRSVGQAPEQYPDC